MKFVLAVDGSEHSEQAARWCAQYANALGAEVVAVHALETPVYATPGVGYMPVRAYSEEERDELAQVVRTQWCAPLVEAGIDVRVIVVEGTPSQTVIEIARSENADLVVTGRRGRGGFAELLLGSTSHQLSHHLDRPLVIVP